MRGGSWRMIAGTPGPAKPYRNAAAFCSGATFNLTNGLRFTWTF